MAKPTSQTDVLVIGDHPCAYFAAALLRNNTSIRVRQVTIPGEQSIERLVAINPEFFDLDPILSPLKRRLDLVPIYGLKFLADDPATSTSHAGKTIGAYIGSLTQIHAAMVKLSAEADVKLCRPRELEIRRLDESGIEVAVDGEPIHAKLLLLAGELLPQQRQMLGLAASADAPPLHRYTFVRLKGTKWHEAGAKPVMVMSLDLRGTLNWGWLLPGAGQIQIAVDQPIDSVVEHPPTKLLEHWINVLAGHGELKVPAAAIDLSAAVSLDLPLGGALAQEGVANRTLLIGPAGGFYTACAEDIYPNCWSAVFAADVAKKALRERHVQDALQPYRHRWGSTLGDYLRGPQQNLRFLLPLVYRNSIMTARLTEAILSGKSVVR